MADPTVKMVRCPQCQAQNPANFSFCWLCHAEISAVGITMAQPLEPSEQPTLDSRGRATMLGSTAQAGEGAVRTLDAKHHAIANIVRAAQAENRAARTFGLSSLMAIVALCGVMVGVFQLNVYLGIGLIVVVTPAMVAHAVRAHERPSAGLWMSMLDWWGGISVLELLATFIFALGSVCVIVVIAAVIAFLVICGP